MATLNNNAHAEADRQATVFMRKMIEANERAASLTRALSDIQFDLINCHQAAGRDACEHIKDAIKIVNRTLAAATRPLNRGGESRPS